MKAGIITFHDTLNYGASLQCYALQKKLNSMGVDTDVIDYKCSWFNKRYSPFYIENKSLSKVLYMLAAMPMNVVKQKKKREFHKRYLKLSSAYDRDTIKNTNDIYDLFITGSDQVFNWKLTDFDTTFFLDFVEKNKRKCSYAASFGFHQLDEDKREKYEELLDGYYAMSVREQSAVELVRDITGKTAQLVSDPVFLLKKEDWAELAKKVDMKNYILLYSINDTAAYKYALKLAEKTGKKLVYLSAPVKRVGSFIPKRNIGPIDFLGWFYNADYIVTDSFHGTAFSIIFEKQFVSLLARQTHNGNSRLSNLLSIVGLDNRIVRAELSLDTIAEKIDYSLVNEKLTEYVESSVNYLERITGANE